MNKTEIPTATPLSNFITPRYFQIEDDFKKLIFEAVKQGCSDILLQPYRPALILKNGNLLAITNRTLDENEISAFVPWVGGRATAASDISQGKSVDSRYEIFDQENKFDRLGNKVRYAFRVNITGILSRGMTSYQIVMRTIPDEPPTIDQIGLDPKFVIEKCTPENGIVLVCGPTGSGKSSTFAAILRFILENDTRIKGNIITAEQPIEFTYDMIQSNHSIITQSEIPLHFKSFLLSNEAAMRRHPHLAMIGELRDEQTIQAAVELALTGHPIFATVHSNTVSTVVKRMISRFPPVSQASAIADLVETVRLIVAQRLIPRADGNGQIAVREYLQFTADIKNELSNVTDINKIVFEIERLVNTKGHSFAKESKILWEKGLISEFWKNRLSGAIDL